MNRKECYRANSIVEDIIIRVCLESWQLGHRTTATKIRNRVINEILELNEKALQGTLPLPSLSTISRRVAHYKRIKEFRRRNRAW